MAVVVVEPPIELVDVVDCGGAGVVEEEVDVEEPSVVVVV